MSIDQPVISYNAYDEKTVRIDYSVLSVGVMTLGLVLMVEVGRHKLGQMTQHSAFYSAVLKRVYSELATLGIVEFLLHLMAEYYEAYDKAKKQVFADVHFLLFYTAILNAVHSALLYVVVKRISKKLWIDTERLDVGHYVELREEFDTIRNELEKLRKRRYGRKKDEISNKGDAENPENGFRVDETSEHYFEFTAAGIAGVVQNLMDTIRFPAIKAKYNNLLLQIRFHELRVHFLQAYNLPLKFQVSDYLIRSEHHVLVKLIKVSPIAWLLLTGLANLVYFVLGIVSYKIQSAKIVGITMIYLFFIALFLFVVLSWILHNKMKRIFKQIMNTGTLWDVDDSSKRTDLSAVQKSLFWAADPKLVIAAIQFMQFGYALAVATVIIFWEELNDGPTPMFWYILVVLACYLVCIVVTAQIIPRYTLCTNLAQLVDEQRLHEALASFRLNEARHRELEKAEGLYHTYLESDSVVSTEPSMDTTRKTGSGGHSLFDNHSTAVLIRNMVKSDITSLRDNLPNSVKESMGSTKRSKNRVKQFSDGVSSMARFRIIQQDSGVLIPNHNEKEFVEHLSSRRGRSRSEGVLFMAKAQHLSLDEVQGTNYEFDPSHSGHSDIHDVPRTTNVQHAIHTQGKLNSSLQIKLYAYFMSRRFIVISNIFGTMFVFFFIGQRIESFFLSENIGNSTAFVHFDFAHDFVFWLLFTWLVLFIVQSLLVFYSIGYRPLVSLKEKTVVVASILDLLLTVFCMVVLLYAESKRCCNPESDEIAIELNRKTAPCSCPAFGSRQYGGLGTIEPWLSIIALRIFRHWFAKRIVLMTEKGKGKLKIEQSITQQSQLLNPFDVFTQSCHKEIKSGQNHITITTHHDGNAADPRGTAAELWEAAIGRHPDIVAKHGEFSVEVLRTMLGLEPYAEIARTDESDRRTRNSPKEKTFTVKKSFAHLSKDAQCFIASGVLGGDVVEIPADTPNGRPHFQLCRLTRQASELSMFIAPDATLIRSMRRCDKKFLPLLQKWVVVDVVLTCFEMVYFTADIIDGCELGVQAEAAREALAATEGGKGCLRLCDVAHGRRVVGSIGLTDLVSVHVQRSTGRGEYMRPVEKSNAEVQNVEYWKKDHFETSAADREGKTRGERWVTVPQDELRLVTSHGETAYFRFYSDLEDASNNPGLYANDDYEKGKIAKNNALHWAQTIGRICGKGQLKQSLAHFGQGDSKEICDYLIFYSHDKKPSFRFSSLRDLADQVEI